MLAKAIQEAIDSELAQIRSLLSYEQQSQLQRDLDHLTIDIKNRPGEDQVSQKVAIYEKYLGLTPQSSLSIPIQQPSLLSHSKISESERQEMQQKIDSLGLNAKVSNEGKMVGENGKKTVKQKIGRDSQIEVNINGELVLVNSLGYEMKYKNNSLGLKDSLETIKTFDYMDKIGFGYFGTNLPDMLEIIKSLGIRKAAFMTNPKETGKFFSTNELHNIVIPIFTEIGFINKPMSQNISEVKEMNDLDMFSLIDQVKVNGVHYGSAFQKGKPFSGDYFKKFLIEKNNIKTI